ncbi:MFS transporter [Glutamicibacter sp.]|uniref:MFS transporter n=1 Tax=Glutamicibacter sp. TaxID=1931995 RepID=UPI0028BE8E9F|nr:MFS transporter [Glutamicibacter sp.]
MKQNTENRNFFRAAFSSVITSKDFRFAWFSNVFFFSGLWTQTLVLGWIAFEMTGSEFLVALFTAARLAPMILGPIAGAFADRLNKVHLLMAACGWAAVAISVVAVLAGTGMLEYWGLVVAGLAIGMAQSPSQPARGALVAELVPARELSNANALNALALNMTQVVGPGIGGIMIATLGAPAALWVSTSWYVLSLLMLLPLRKHQNLSSGQEHGSMLRLMVEGLKLVGRNRLAVGVLLVTFSANALLWPVYQSFMPIFAEQRLHLDAAGLGALLMAAGIGGLLGSIAIASLGDFKFKGALFVYGTMVWAALWAVFAFLTNVPAAFIILCLVGFSSAAFGVLQTTLLLIVTPPELHGRVMGIQELAIGIMPIATLLLGLAAESIGVALTTFIAAVLLILVLGLLVMLIPAVTKIGRETSGELVETKIVSP